MAFSLPSPSSILRIIVETLTIISRKRIRDTFSAGVTLSLRSLETVIYVYLISTVFRANSLRETMTARRKIAVLGGGMGSLSAAFWLTSQPDWQQNYDITVYQM